MNGMISIGTELAVRADTSMCRFDENGTLLASFLLNPPKRCAVAP